MCHDTSNWVEILPIVLIGIRTAIKKDLNSTVAEMIYGTGFRLPAEIFLPAIDQANSDYVNRVKERIGNKNKNSYDRTTWYAKDFCFS
jgi:hypothetical protein